MDLPEDRFYTEQHEWARAEGTRVVVGITDYAQDQLGDIVFVGLPEPGLEVAAGEALGEVESTKSVSDVFSPVGGTVVAKNDRLEEAPELVNSDPYGEGWLVVIETGDDTLDNLLSVEEYSRLIDQP